MSQKIEIKHSVVIINNSDANNMRTGTQEKQSCVVGFRTTPYLKEAHEMLPPEEFLEWKRMNEEFLYASRRRREEQKLTDERNAQKRAEAEILANHFRDKY